MAELFFYPDYRKYQREIAAKTIEELEALLYEEEKKENYEKCVWIRDELNSRLEKSVFNKTP